MNTLTEKTTVSLDVQLKKQAQIRALNENTSLSEILNKLLEVYLNDQIDLRLKEDDVDIDEVLKRLHKTDLGIDSKKIDRDLIYELD